MNADPVNSDPASPDTGAEPVNPDVAPEPDPDDTLEFDRTEETIIVNRAPVADSSNIDDETVIAARAGIPLNVVLDDERDADDRTVVVTRQSADGADGAELAEDRATPADDEPDDHTVVVTRQRVEDGHDDVDDHTVVAARQRAEPAQAEPAQPEPAKPKTAAPALPDPAPWEAEVWRTVAWPADQPDGEPGDLSRVWRDIPRVYGVRSSANPSIIGMSDAPEAPAGVVVTPVDRSNLPSVVRASRRSGWWILGAFGAVVIAAIAGGIATIRALMG